MGGTVAALGLPAIHAVVTLDELKRSVPLDGR
jgi:hypothetical protein